MTADQTSAGDNEGRGVDYRALLRKYMDHVAECEGTDFLGGRWRAGGLTDEEWAELQRIADAPADPGLDQQ